jgi:Tol biopolymer transport system component
MARGGRQAIADTASLWNGNVEAGHPMAALVRWNGSNGHVSRILDSGGLDHGPQFSPDGRRLVFASDRSGSREIWVADASGQNPVRLTSMGVHLTGTPRWSPDGRWIVFDSYPDGNGDIFIVNAGGGDVRRVTSAPSSEAVPSWSRDGRWVYFASDRTGEWQVWKQQVMGGAEVQVTRQGGFAAFESHDGRWTYFARHDAPGLWKVPVEGGEETQVLEQLAAGLWGYWALAPDGVYFAELEPSVKGPEEARTRLRFLSFASGALSTVAELEGHPVEWDPGLAVSPNGQSILYARLREAEPGTD